MFLLLLHPLDSWKVAMIFVSNIIHRVTFLFSLLFSFYWTCQKFSSSCWRIIALSRCQIKLAKCLNTGADSISRSRGWLRRAGRVTAAGPSVECSDLRGERCGSGHEPTHWYQRAMTSPRSPGAHSTHAEKWSDPHRPIRWFMPHKMDNLLCPNQVVIGDILNSSIIFLSTLEKLSLMISSHPGPDNRSFLVLHTPFELSSC